jgi:hypothetical protein
MDHGVHTPDCVYLLRDAPRLGGATEITDHDPGATLSDRPDGRGALRRPRVQHHFVVVIKKRLSRCAGASIAAFVGLWLAPMTGGLAHAETPEVSPGSPISLGNRGWSAAVTEGAAPVNELEVSARAGFASDYIYRGTTLSDHEPHIGPGPMPAISIIVKP